MPLPLRWRLAGAAIAIMQGSLHLCVWKKPGFQEVHPFTISQAPGADRTLRFTIKNLGDYTGAVDQELEQGLRVRVSRPFGHFRLPRKTGEQVWIASGVGITPFVAWAQALSDDAGPVHLFYSARTRKLASHLPELEDLAASKPNLNLHMVETQSAGRLTPEQIMPHLQGDVRKASVAFCGPKEMREAFRHGLIKQGLSARRFQYEEFEIRSGIGLWALISAIISRVGHHPT